MGSTILTFVLLTHRHGHHFNNNNNIRPLSDISASVNIGSVTPDT